MRRNVELETTIVEKYAAVEAFLDERGRRIWAATESRAIGYGEGCSGSGRDGIVAPDQPQGARGARIGRR